MFQVLSQSKKNRHSSFPIILKKELPQTKGFFVEKAHDHQGLTLLFCEPTTGPIGGATLIKRQASHLPLKIKGLFHQFMDNDTLWECNTVFFMIPDHSFIHDNFDYFSALCYQFYGGLYTYIHKFAIENNIKHFISVNPTEEHQDISYFGQWPFAYEIEVKNLHSNNDQEHIIGLMTWDEDTSYS